MLAFHEWSASRLRIGELDPKERAVTFTGRTRTSDWWGKFGAGTRFLAVNVKEALSEPGEWSLDRGAGRLTYIPRPGEDPAKARIVASGNGYGQPSLRNDASGKTSRAYW